MKTSDLRTAKGYALKENLRRCWHHRLERTARAHFRSWIRWAKRSALKPFAQVAAMIDSQPKTSKAPRTTARSIEETRS